MKFPTFHCRCEDGHEWASLIPKAWFRPTDIECPNCSKPVVAMKAGDFRSLDQIKKASPIVPLNGRESENNSV